MPFLQPYADNIKSPERCNLGVNQAHNFCVGVSVALLNIFLVRCVMPCILIQESFQSNPI